MFHDERGLLQGTLELLVLKALTWGPTHGYGIAKWIEGATGDALRVEEGSLYPALHRMAKKGWVESEWGLSENKRRAKYYSLTPLGRTQFTEKSEGWEDLVSAVGKAMEAGETPAVQEGR